jgi:hypothetical protein
MAVTLDIGDVKEHPPGKVDTGFRLARLALHHDYGLTSLVPSGPLYKSHVVEGSIEDYLDFCNSRGEEPDKPYSGKFVLRVEPALQRRLSALSTEEGTSLNSWIKSKLELLTKQA